MTCSIQIYDVTRKHFVVLRCLILNTLPLTGCLTADVLFDPILSSVPARDRLPEWQEIRWLPVALVCAQVTDRPVIREDCLIFHARESSERLSKAFPASPPYLRPPLLIGISHKKKPSFCDCTSSKAKKGGYLLGHSLVFQAANVYPVDFDWLESGRVHPEPLLNICHFTCQSLLISNHFYQRR